MTNALQLLSKLLQMQDEGVNLEEVFITTTETLPDNKQDPYWCILAEKPVYTTVATLANKYNLASDLAPENQILHLGFNPLVDNE